MTQSFFDLSRDALRDTLAQAGMPPFRTAQLWTAIYAHGVSDFAEITTLAKPVRPTLATHFSLARPKVVREQLSVDGTRKWLLELSDGNRIESVFIPEDDRGTLCVSSQVGCTLTCRFCHTGTQRLKRNLTAGEIVAQVMHARDALGDWSKEANAPRKLTNIVMMGQGEPLYNYDNVATALKIIMDGEGIALGRRKITLSTSGVVPMIERCGQELGVNLAISLHAVTDEIRTKILPLNRKYPIAELLEACRRYPGLSNARRITFEYIMLHGVNDTPEDAHALVTLLRGIPAKINLIPFNPWVGSPFQTSMPEAIERFGTIVNRAGYASPVRTPRGQDISAACGQLHSDANEQHH